MSRKSDEDVKKLRAQIDKLDQQILEFMNKRASLAMEIGKLKSESGGIVFAPAREEEVISNLLEKNKGPLPPVTIRSVYRELISGSRSLQRVLKIAFLGPEYSFSHLAAMKQFGQGVELMAVGNISAIFEEVARQHVDYGVVPLENSTDGRIADTLDMFVKMPELKICSEVRVRVHHNLLANCEQTEIHRIYSKPQALSQCRNWLSKNVPQATLHEVTSTAAAAQLVQQQPNTAAVASREAAVRYGIRILYSNIEDSQHNETRFAVIGTHDSGRTGKDKTAIMFQIPHSPGSLADILNLFKSNKVNLTWIESFPFRDAKGEYIFFADFEGHAEDAKVKKTLQGLEKTCDKLSILGSFPIAPLEE
ncbi:prephenate dehydratase [Telmatocola sphagniphila]|uniref:Bifunctional chorismate mutase/prephenate dehydratase n=1 Tax=Telmatocola sphagniphila TaxID=1123043 RepID=A0A8E6B928_9BACT|nr:prephenate dehydratase [Telmatocola sphagniphila]QVL34425.1 prephenate dehydratase [Telmatocola sphagniphila]